MVGCLQNYIYVYVTKKKSNPIYIYIIHEFEYIFLQEDVVNKLVELVYDSFIYLLKKLTYFHPVFSIEYYFPARIQ